MTNYNPKILNFSLLNTKACNLHCSYCYEKGGFENKEYSKEDIDKIIKFLKGHVDAGNSLILTLIGGEPTLAKNNQYLFNKIRSEFDPNSIKEIRVITNGYNFDLLKRTFSDQFWKEFKDKIEIQISYDGKVIQDIDRVKIINGIKYGTSKNILDTLDKCIQEDLNISFKSTLDIKYLYLVPEVLKEFQELNIKYQEYLKRKPGRIRYYVTEVKDLFSFYNENQIKSWVDKAFPEILKIEKENLEKLGSPLSKWLLDYDYKKYTTEKQYCAAGMKLFSIDPELNLDFCHHVPYINKGNNDLRFGSILDPNLYKKVKEKINFYEKKSNIIPDECKNCEAIYCLHCPIENYKINKNINDLYKPFLNKNLCFYYKYISKYIHFFVKKFLKKN